MFSVQLNQIQFTGAIISGHEILQNEFQMRSRTTSEFKVLYSCVFSILQGGVVNRGLKQFFSLYRPSCFIEAYVRPKSTGWCGLDPWLTIHSILTSYFLATA
jgi:hypothetical protein